MSGSDYLPENMIMSGCLSSDSWWNQILLILWLRQPFVWSLRWKASPQQCKLPWWLLFWWWLKCKYINRHKVSYAVLYLYSPSRQIKSRALPGTRKYFYQFILQSL